jgi:phospholipase A1/A2
MIHEVLPLLKTGILILAAGLTFSLLPATGTFAMAAEEIATPQGNPLERPLPQEPRQVYPDLDTLHALYQPYAVNISAYEPIYFLVGTEPEKSKLQISFKYRFFNPQGTLTSRHPWMLGFHFGYTQTLFWDLQEASAPFDDNSYKPELFFVSGNIKPRLSWMDGFFIQTGFQHESNGSSGDLSRSTNFLYVRPIAIFYSPGNQYGLLLAGRIWTNIYNSSRNHDLDEYRGYFELESKFGKADGWVLGSTLGWASRGASVTMDLTYPIHKILRDNLDFYFQIQYTNALAESLLDYRQRTKALRLGIAIVR